jgi:hypothetical protein
VHHRRLLRHLNQPQLRAVLLEAVLVLLLLAWLLVYCWVLQLCWLPQSPAAAQLCPHLAYQRASQHSS